MEEGFSAKWCPNHTPCKRGFKFASFCQVCGKYPALKVVTSEIDQGLDETTFQVIPGIN